MRRLLAIVLFLFLVSTSQAQEPYKVYLPIIMLKDLPKNAWQIVKPVASTNYVLNPSAETTGNFAATGSATITRVTTYQKYGLYSYRVQTVATNTGLSLTTGTLTNSDHFMTLRIRGRLPKELRLSIGPDSKRAIFIEQIDDYWALYGAMFDASESNGRTSARISQFGAGSGDFYVDGIQIEPLSDWTTYVDGTQDGCEWNGVEHASTSSRSGEYIGGGTPQDLYQEYKFFVTKIIGAGASTQTLNTDSYAILPGGELNSIKVESRQFTLIGKFIADTETELHDARQDLIKTLKLARPGQPLKLRFSGGRVQKEIGVFYQGGLEGDLAAFYSNLEPIEDDQWGEVKSYIEVAAIQFNAPDPYWYEVGESAASLDNASDVALYTEQDTNESATFRLVAGRLKSTGQWSPLGPPAAGGTYTTVYALAEDATYLYIGGDFLNWDGIANADNIVRYNKQTGIYSAMDVGLNSNVRAIAIGPDGRVYVGGQFTNASGVAAADFLAVWGGTSFGPVGTPNTGIAAITGVFALKFDHSGNLYIGGLFNDWNNQVLADNVVMWNGSIYTPLSVGLNAAVEAFAVGPDNTVIIGGLFTNAGSIAAADYIVSWNGTAYSALGTGGPNNFVFGMDFDASGILYVGGTFTNLVNFAIWNGVAWKTAGSGTNGGVYSIKVGRDNIVYLSGAFSAAGPITFADRIARWNGYTYSHLDLDLPGSPTAYALLASKYVDPVIRQKYDLYLGFDTTGVGYFAGKTTINNEGNVSAFPQIVYFRSGGTYAIIETLRNERTGKELLFDYRLLSGESLTIDLTPTKKSITSSFFGPRLDAVLPNSDFGTWQLLPGNNDITTFVPVSGGPVLTAWLIWRDTYDGWD